MALTGCSVTKFVTGLPRLLKHVWRLPISWFSAADARRLRSLPLPYQGVFLTQLSWRYYAGWTAHSSNQPEPPLNPFCRPRAPSWTNAVVLLKAASLLTPSPSSHTQIRSSKNEVAWTWKFNLSMPAEKSTTLRFSAVPRDSTSPWRSRAICSSFRLPAWSHHPSLQLWLSLLAWSRYSIYPVRTQTLG